MPPSQSPPPHPHTIFFTYIYLLPCSSFSHLHYLLKKIRSIAAFVQKYSLLESPVFQPKSFGLILVDWKFHSINGCFWIWRIWEETWDTLLWRWSCDRNGRSPATRFWFLGASTTCCAVHSGVSCFESIFWFLRTIRIKPLCISYQNNHQNLWNHPVVEINPSVHPFRVPNGTYHNRV